MIKVKSLSIWIFSVLLLVLTIVGAMAFEGGSVELENVYLSGDSLKVEYVPVLNGSGLVVCEVFVENQSYISNIISAPNKLNRISEDDSFAEGDYLFMMRCEQDDVLVESKSVLLRFTESEELIDENNDSEKKSFLNNPSEVFFTVIILVAAFIIVKSLIPKNDKKKNKRLRRFA
jgi:hypothetical protein